MNSPVSLGVSPTVASTPTGVFNQWFEALFPCTGDLGCIVCFTPLLFLPFYLYVNVELRAGSASCRTACPFLPPSASCLAASPLCPSCRSLPLLLVWMNVFSLSPWLLDFHGIRFSMSSGCFLFSNCCCPSFGCARRCSVSTYASILAGSSINTYLDVCFHFS